MVLVHLGAQAILEGKTVLHYTLELADTTIASRYDSCITGVPLRDLFSFKEQIYESVQDLEGKLIGINNRDLTNGKTDLGISRRLIPMALQEKDKVLVCESGINGRNEIEEFEALGVDAFLIGESLMTSQNIPEKLKELLGYDGS